MKLTDEEDVLIESARWYWRSIKWPLLTVLAIAAFFALAYGIDHLSTWMGQHVTDPNWYRGPNCTHDCIRSKP